MKSDKERLTDAWTRMSELLDERDRNHRELDHLRVELDDYKKTVVEMDVVYRRLKAEVDALREPDPLLQAQGLVLQMQTGEVERLKAERDAALADVHRLQAGLNHGAYWLRQTTTNPLFSRTLTDELIGVAIHLEACADGEDIAADERLAT